MKRVIGLLITIILLGYGLMRMGVGGLLLAQTLGVIDFTELANAVSEVKVFVDARASEQIFPFNVPAYFTYILAMGILLTTGAAGVIYYKRWGFVLLSIYLLMHAALFLNFQEINPKLVGLVLQLVMLFALFYLRPPKGKMNIGRTGIILKSREA